MSAGYRCRRRRPRTYDGDCRRTCQCVVLNTCSGVLVSTSSRIGFVIKPEMNEANKLLEQLVPWLAQAGHSAVVAHEDRSVPASARVVPEDSLVEEIDVLVVLGGDGTMLRASSVVGDSGIPVLGINLGRLGFLTPFDPLEARGAIAAAVAGDLNISERMRLLIRYRSAESDTPVERMALNDVVIHQGAMARLIELDAYLDDGLISSYRADGIIVATPTGSTAYNLAAGGPILVPGQKAMALTPICAHALTMRPLVVPDDGTIRVRLGGDSRGVVLTADGQWAHSFLPGDELAITAAPAPLRVFDSSKRYFDILREKLHWGARSDRAPRD